MAARAAIEREGLNVSAPALGLVGALDGSAGSSIDLTAKGLPQ